MSRIRRFTGITQEYSLPLIFGVLASLVLANVDSHLYEDIVDWAPFGHNAHIFGHEVTVHFLVNGMFMVLFFGIAAKEITESVLPGGTLNPPQKAVNPLMGTLGGVLGPAGAYFLITFIIYGGSDDFSTVANGWAIPTATDIALAWLVARLVFGAAHPAVSFLLLLAVGDDAIGLGIIAVFYPDPDHPFSAGWLLLIVAGMGAALALRRLRVASWIPYILVGGAMSWVGLVKASLEPALALVVIVPFLPGPRHHDEPGVVEAGGKGSPITSPVHGNSPLERFERHLKTPVDFGLFFFAFANAGVAFSSINGVTWTVLLALILGKTVGISLFSLAALRFGFPLPAGMGVKHLIVAGLVAAIGLTVALFVAGKAFDGPPFQDPAKMGAVLSGGVALLAIAAGRVLGLRGEPGPGTKDV